MVDGSTVEHSSTMVDGSKVEHSSTMVDSSTVEHIYGAGCDILPQGALVVRAGVLYHGAGCRVQDAG